ncbi:FAD dependent oxidoreductase [Dactylonectria macrodidyma]|uniref:L-2-hydroxyglutarate dehydrogenase, mitochondrial n=1 Tax=Dactylonectria macrodidyma TaxID=307937 RepID=A0A9P9JBU4_9HYPO|nr:FAD dependent oxidoreductase [Dactylonectria macrodidyma]
MATNGDASANPRSDSPTRSPRSASISLQAAATMNAGLQHEPTRRSSSTSLSRNRSSLHTDRRRSAVLMNLQLNDPAVPAPGEMVHEPSSYRASSPQPLSGSPSLADPHHHRAPSLGELHQELEAEQEAHVNRLLHMIRQQQLELQRLQSGQPLSQNSAVDDAISERSGHGTPHASSSHINIPSVPSGGSFPRSASSRHPRSSFDMARADLQRRSRTPSRGASPRMRSTSIGGDSGEWALGGRDESAFYQAETQMLTRENQMLRIIGGGAVRVSIARQLSRRDKASTLLTERHNAVGTETSSRNSEVIHAGIYYGLGSLKMRLCAHGKNLLYDFCDKYGVGFRSTGKGIVAQNDAQCEAFNKIHAMCKDEIGVPIRWIGEDEIERDGEGVHAIAALDNPTTGIIDSHGLMLRLLGLFEVAGGVTALNSPVVAETLINAAGLGAVDVHDMIVPAAQHKRLYYAKGNYFSYGTAHPRVTRLIYPAPEPGAADLGTHLTLDLGGRLRFGPDVEWVDRPDDLAVNASRLPQAVGEITKYLPSVDETFLVPDYAGIRPKLPDRGAVLKRKSFNDFIIREEDGYGGWVNLLGIESPGLTSSLAIAEEAEELMYASL